METVRSFLADQGVWKRYKLTLYAAWS